MATDDAGRPSHGEDAGVVRLGRGEGILLFTDQAAACALTAGEWLDGAAGLVLSCDLDEVVAVTTDATPVRRQVRAITVELGGASWGAVGLAVVGEVERHVGQREAPIRKMSPKVLAERLARHARG